MKIGVDIRCLLEPQYSGISEYTYNLLTQLFQSDTENQYFLFYNVAKRSIVPQFNYPNVTVKGFSYPNKLFNLGIRFLHLAEIDKLLGGVDVFLIPNFLFLNLSASCKKIIIVHDLSFIHYPDFFTVKQRLWHTLINPRRLCLQADRIIAISENTKNDVVNLFGVRSEKVSVIYNGISDVFFQPINDSVTQEMLQRYDLKPGYILSLGNLEPRKNVAAAIDAFSQLNDQNAQLVIAGHPAWKYQSLYQRWRHSPARNRIRFLGYIDERFKPSLYQQARVFVYPSLFEGFGLPPLEAMACGTPVIAGFNPAVAESIADAGILVDPYNINELAQSMSVVLADNQLHERLALRGLERSQRFRLSAAGHEVLSIIESISI